MLSWSAETTSHRIDFGAIGDGHSDPGVPGGRELIAFVNATLSGDSGATGVSRAAVGAVLGQAAVVDAAAVTGNFEMMNRIADGVGMPVGRTAIERNNDLISTLGIEGTYHGP